LFEGRESDRARRMGGQPIRIVVGRDDSSFELEEDALVAVLLQDHCRDENVVDVSVPGAFQRGKSFLLHFFLWYMVTQGRHDWIGSEGEKVPEETL
jgi:hypothetical protein